MSASLSSGEECTERQRIRYYSKISGPLLDRIDIQIDVPKVEFKEMISKTESETSAVIRTRVQRASKKQLRRFQSRNIYRNAQMGTKEVKIFCLIGKEGKELLEMAVTKLGFSARAYTRVLKSGTNDCRP